LTERNGKRWEPDYRLKNLTEEYNKMVDSTPNTSKRGKYNRSNHNPSKSYQREGLSYTGPVNNHYDSNYNEDEISYSKSIDSTDHTAITETSFDTRRIVKLLIADSRSDSKNNN
jgi:hypothetical protein